MADTNIFFIFWPAMDPENASHHVKKSNNIDEEMMMAADCEDESLCCFLNQFKRFRFLSILISLFLVHFSSKNGFIFFFVKIAF